MRRPVEEGPFVTPACSAGFGGAIGLFFKGFEDLFACFLEKKLREGLIRHGDSPVPEPLSPRFYMADFLIFFKLFCRNICLIRKFVVNLYCQIKQVIQ